MIKLLRLVIFLLLVLADLPGFAAKASEPTDIGFRLQDFLGRRWQNESVRFPLSPEQIKSAKAGRALVGPDEKPVAYQIVGGASASPSIEFLADLNPYETRTYRFTGATAPAATDLHVEENRDVIRLRNSRVGIALRKRLAPEQGPIESVRLASGKWIGNSLFKSGQHVSSYGAEIVAKGPAFAEVICRITFAAGMQWELRFRIQANEPVILIDETFSLGDASSFVLVLNQNFTPSALLYRYGSGTIGQLATWNLKSGEEPVFVLEPWLHWWERQRQGTWFALYNDKETDLLALGAREPAVWVDPMQKQEMRSSTQLPLALDKGSLTWTLPLKAGARKWMIAALNREASLEPLKSNNQHVAPLPQQYLIKHGDFPLNRVKDYVFKWPGDETGHPRLMMKAVDVAKLRGTFKADPAKLAQLAKAPISEQHMDEPIVNYLATGDVTLGKHLAMTAVEWVQKAVDMFLRQDTLVAPGFAPHQQWVILTAMNLADVVWSSEHISPEMRERLKAQLAFLAYTVNRQDYWSPERGFSANPSMTTTVAAFQSILACMIPAHPLARAWLDNGTRELKENQLDGWSDENGGWLEAPHYAMVAYDYLLGAFLAARNAGFNDYLYDPKMKKVIEWLAKTSTPPDAAADGRRHFAPVGNTYMREPSGEFGLVAYLWKDKDPEFASEMQWMYRQQGFYPVPGVGGFFPTLEGYRTLLANDTIPEKAPAYKSEWFPRTGVMLRNHFPSDRETQLHLISGPNHAHYDKDSGSFALWGKGRLIANDFGYYGYAPGEDHNMVVASTAADAAIMRVTDFLTGENVDYVRGVKGDWERQIVFMKDPDPLGPNYFVFSDSVKGGVQSIWRTWFSAPKVVLRPQGAVVSGDQDVDADIFFANPDGIAAATEWKTRETWGLTGDKYGRVSTTQIGLIVPLKSGGGLTTVLYPRLKTEKQPVFTRLTDGNGVKVETSAGTDYVFLSDRPFAFHEGKISFEGTVGAVLIRGGRALLWLGQPGKIAANGEFLGKEPVRTDP